MQPNFNEVKVLSPLRYALGSAAFVMKWRKKASPNVAERVQYFN